MTPTPSLLALLSRPIAIGMVAVYAEFDSVASGIGSL